MTYLSREEMQAYINEMEEFINECIGDGRITVSRGDEYCNHSANIKSYAELQAQYASSPGYDLQRQQYNNSAQERARLYQLHIDQAQSVRQYPYSGTMALPSGTNCSHPDRLKVLNSIAHKLYGGY